ncbi:MAG: DNA sulfur modification protein DndD [Oscillospiraceae bacterium]
MIIKRLSLHNFGIYASDNTFLFQKKGRKSVTLIGGMNGRGKTTFLEAVLLALYGANSFAVSESKNSYGKYLRSHVNVEDGTLESFVELEFEMHEENDNNIYVVKRSWNANSLRTRDYVEVKKNGNNDAFLTQNWTMFIESILPSGLANFFFFDGEKIAELAEGETSSQMKESIKALLGITVIDTLDGDLNRIVKRLQDEKTVGYDAVRLEELKAIKEDKEEKLKEIDLAIKEIENDITKTNTEIDKKTEAFQAKGGNIADQSKQLFSEHGHLSGRIEQVQTDFIDLAATELPLALVEPFLKRIVDQSTNERERQTTQIAINKINDYARSFVLERNENDNLIAEFINFINSQSQNNTVKSVFNLSETAYAQLSLLCSSQLETAKNSYVEDKASIQNMQLRLNEIDNYLAVDIDEKAIQKIYKKICELKNRRIELEAQLESKQKERTTVNGEYMRATTEFNRCVEHSLQVMEREDDKQRLSGYALRVKSTLTKYRMALQKAKVDELALKMTECYKRLLGKRNLIYKIEMDPETLDYYYLDKKGVVIPKTTLSAGEKQLMVISMLWALGECSHKKLPVIIDTPLARLDSVHRTALIEKYFPKASDQTIILSTDAEIDATYYELMHKVTSNEFTLVYDEETKHSTIEEGYFKGVIG